MSLILPINADAAKKSLLTTGTTGTLSIVGLVTTETVAVEVPRVASPDDATDAHWTPWMQEGVAVALDVDNNVIRIPALLRIRLNKAAGVAANAYGVEWT